jgi:uncharacterized damage-inducible protein DinB
MMDLKDSNSLWFEYDLYANKRVLASLEGNIGHLPDDSLKLFSHVLAAHHIWLCRISGSPSQFQVWERIAITEMEKVMQNNFSLTADILNEAANWKEITYTNTQGKSFTNSVPDILFHVLTHNHYHRGQIARNLRENGIEPPETNYIVYRR